METEAHAHRWRVATPEPGRPDVAAVCTSCGKERTFPAWLNPELEAAFVVSKKRYAKKKAANISNSPD